MIAIRVWTTANDGSLMMAAASGVTASIPDLRRRAGTRWTGDCRSPWYPGDRSQFGGRYV